MNSTRPRTFLARRRSHWLGASRSQAPWASPIWRGFGALPDHGADIVWWERPQGGRVFAAGSIGVSGSLVSDPGIGTLVRNVFRTMGISRRESDA